MAAALVTLPVNKGSHASTSDAGDSQLVGIVRPNVGGVVLPASGEVVRLLDIINGGADAIQVVVTNVGSGPIEPFSVSVASCPPSPSDPNVGATVTVYSTAVAGGGTNGFVVAHASTNPNGVMPVINPGESHAFTIRPRGAHVVTLWAVSAFGATAVIDVSG